MDLSQMMTQMGILVFTAGLGFIGAKAHYIPREANRILSQLVLDIVLACSVIYSAASNTYPLTNAQVAMLALAAAAAAAVLIVLSKLGIFLFRIRKEDKGVCEYMLIFSSSALMGYPVIRACYGTDAVFFAAILNMVFTTLCYTYGVGLIRGDWTRKSRTWRELISPVIACSLLAWVIYVFQIRLPPFFVDALGYLDQVASPLSMLIVGSTLAYADRIRAPGLFRVFSLVALRIIVTPLLAYAVFRPLFHNDMMTGIFVIFQALPAAVSTTMFCARFEKDGTIAALCVLLSTALSAVILPLYCFTLLLR